MITIERAPPHEPERCECCGGVAVRLTRFVHRNGDAFAVYYARFSPTHPGDDVDAIVSIGGWHEGTGPADRSAFALKLRSGESSYEVMVVDADKSPWSDVDILGEMLSREAALKRPELRDVFHITDHMFAEDEDLKSYLDAAS